ncbi:MAG TPA: LytTR family DNA-binding domain-containing protein, partial [Chthonomonadales bacterium]|nr:LytTR family DNA-binding domain-containing protein [Chthonomonadales bacterium]
NLLMPITSLVVDDEPLARAHLKRLLEIQMVVVLAEAEDAETALQLADDLGPDLAFLDVQMPGISGLQLAAMLANTQSPPLCVFVTGYSEHAIAAFERGALDYLVKPISPERLSKTLARARDRLQSGWARVDTELQAAAPAAPLTRLPVRLDYSVQFIRIQDILFAAARDKRVFLQTDTGEWRTYYTLSQLETLLPAEQFARVHDSYIVCVDEIGSIQFLGNHSYTIQLRNGRQLPVGRTRYAELCRRLGVKPSPTT